MPRTKTNALKEINTKSTAKKASTTRNSTKKEVSKPITKNTKTSNSSSELQKANEKIALLESKLQTFIEIVYREMSNELSEGPRALSKKMSRANLLSD